MDNNENTTDATRGSSLRVRVETRKQELELALAKLGSEDRARGDIEQALNEVTSLLTGDLDQIPRVVAAMLSHVAGVEQARQRVAPLPGSRRSPRAGRPRSSVTLCGCDHRGMGARRPGRRFSQRAITAPRDAQNLRTSP